ncbi:MAG: exodeoxyribonuclease VII large subunit [Betaproteobacteria bacterium]
MTSDPPLFKPAAAALPTPRGATLNVPMAAVLPVSLLVSSARLLIERHLGLVWVSGEISNFVRAASGHCYFNLKDAQAQARCVFFRQKAQHAAFALRDGLQVEVRATPSIYEARGEFQLNVDSIRLAGIGALYEKFAQLKARLEAAGWFAEARKRPLPVYPRAIGIVTSTRAAALRDILTTLRRRWPAAAVVIYPTAVQGDGAAPEIANAIGTANARAEVDVLIVGRGGGSIEDLWAFNEEVVARAVFESTLPIVSGVGHETDFTICDFVADVRAPTPTAAAEAVTPDRVAIAHRVEQLLRRIGRSGQHVLAARTQQLDGAARRLVHPVARMTQESTRLQELTRRIARAWRMRTTAHVATATALQGRLLRELGARLPQAQRLEFVRAILKRSGSERLTRSADRLAGLTQNLAHLNPQAVLERGYAIVAGNDGTIVQDAQQVRDGEAVALTFARGGADATITRRREF